MGLGDIRHEHVIAATEEFRRLGRDKFLRTYSFGRAMSYELVLDGRRYDSKAIAGVAHGYATGVFWKARDFSGGAATVARCLRELGFVVETGEPSSNRVALNRLSSVLSPPACRPRPHWCSAPQFVG
ncbi:hypothetical protein [Streptomyces sp. E2N171]|uniref:hypothetical protein n=1 Tax=Streptomyces sp. E2N171 TaxID=1851914 RepID=UPI00129268E7|nr:hypothetical protein [Streptomyces sp. E2N171]